MHLVGDLYHAMVSELFMSVTIFILLCHLYHFILKGLYLQNISYFISSQFLVQG